mgnify:CR=1 FL=1
MKIVRPSLIDDAALITSSATETVALWNSGTTYALGDQVRDDTEHKIYESLQASNTNHLVSDTAWWFEVGPTNRWAMFDEKINTVTTGATGLDVAIQPTGRVDTLALLNIDAASVHVTAIDGADGVIFDQTYSMVSDSGITDWYAYFYEPILRKTDLIITDIPLYNAPGITVSLDAAGSPVSAGVLIVGQAKDIGSTAYGASIGITDYSRKEADAFGNYTIVERAFSRKGSFRLMVDGGLVDEVARFLSSYRATPALYIGADDYTSTAIYGFFRDFNIEIAYPTTSFCSLEIEGLT